MPMPTPEYEQHLQDMRRAGRRADGEKTPDRSDAARDTSGVRPDLPDPRLLGSQRIWVSDDRRTLLTIWYDTPSDYIVGKPANVTVAYRGHPSQTWGPPIMLIEEKT